MFFHQGIECLALGFGHCEGHGLEALKGLLGVLHAGFDEGSHGHAGLKTGALGDEAKVGVAAYHDAPPIGLVEAFDQAKKRRLAATVAAHDADLLTRIEFKAGAREHFLGGIVLLDIFQTEQAHGAFPGPRLRLNTEQGLNLGFFFRAQGGRRRHAHIPD